MTRAAVSLVGARLGSSHSKATNDIDNPVMLLDCLMLGFVHHRFTLGCSQWFCSAALHSSAATAAAAAVGTTRILWHGCLAALESAANRQNYFGRPRNLFYF
jgi:hypothetical protein